MKRETLLAQAGSRWDGRTGAVSMPVYHAATFAHPALGQSTGFDYSRSGNPTRQVLEETVAKLEGGARCCAFSSGMAAIDCLLRLFAPGDRIVVTEDLYGGTFRLFEKVYRPLGIEAVYVDTSRTDEVARALEDSRVRAVFVETPTNPLLKIADIAAISALCREKKILSIIDNTFLTPYLQRPFELGSDITVYSGTKYLAGHNDVVAGFLVAKDPDIGERLYFHQNAAGAVLGPQDCWLLLRGLKTLPLRLERQQDNALAIARFLAGHRRVTRVFYPGLEGHEGHALQRRQADGWGAMISFEVDDPALVPEILAGIEVFIFAESLGGVESLITFPSVQTHADIPVEVRERLGVNDRLLRMSVGVENVHDLIADLAKVLGE